MSLRSNQKRLALRWMSCMFLALAVTSLGYVGFTLVDAKAFQVYANWRLNHSIERSRVSSLQPLSVTLSNHGDAVSAIPPAGGSAIGRIEISRIGVSVIIAEGTEEGTLRRAVGHITGTALPGELGNVALAGHRDTFFRALSNIRLDDQVTLTTPKGSFSYRVESIEVVAPSDTELLKDSSESVLTLVTCYPFYFVGPAPKRFVVRAHRT